MRLSVCRNLLLGEIDREERERCWYFSQLEALSQKLAHLPRIDTVRTHTRTHTSTCIFLNKSSVLIRPLFALQFSLQMDLIRHQLEFEAQQVRSVMEERFGTSDEMVQRTQVRLRSELPHKIPELRVR